MDVFSEIVELKREIEEELLLKENVIGVAAGYKETGGQKTSNLSVVCLVEHKVPEFQLLAKDLIPKNVQGVPLDVQETGRIVVFSSPHKTYQRPCKMGTSGGHYLTTAGTNGELLRDKGEWKLCIGTNNHVAANSNQARVGDPYLQPGPYDGGWNIEKYIIGNLLRFVPIIFQNEENGNEEKSCPVAQFWAGIYNSLAQILGRKTRLKAVVPVVPHRRNLVDAALVEVKNPKYVRKEIMGIGVPKGLREAELGMKVQKSGRTTGHTTGGIIDGLDTVVDVDYGGRVARFERQIYISGEGFSRGGDSGSLILDMERYAVGKLFAGSDNSTIANPIHAYLQALGAFLITESGHVG